MDNHAAHAYTCLTCQPSQLGGYLQYCYRSRKETTEHWHAKERTPRSPPPPKERSGPGACPQRLPGRCLCLFIQYTTIQFSHDSTVQAVQKQKPLLPILCAPSGLQDDQAFMMTWQIVSLRRPNLIAARYAAGTLFGTGLGSA
ncbi:hypothetical protein BD289DRAFT_144613 [Coniella lustricola]|uniref:Uncharacterized protein n=1 Tax=Coniella lustricola TaxID=2025994 RepID=A0A2T3AEY1_9PEZI|nr:hypothetical protein BD289DRAFT_144613 [Coniella lustricola]